MSTQMVTSGIGAENRLFIGAVSVSLLLHLALLCWGKMPAPGGKMQDTAPDYSPIEVALAPAGSVPERVVAPRESRPQQNVRTPVRTLPEPVKNEPVQEQAAATQETALEERTGATESAAEASDGVAQSSASADNAARDRYLATVLAHIESHKYYPLPARRRGMQGRVNVSFMLDARGMISDLDVTGSNSLFVEAARAAVRNAIPLPAAPSVNGFPLAVRYQMIFKLQ